MSKTFQKPIVYILLFIICISLYTNYFKVYRLNNSYAQITLLDTDTQKTIKGRGVVGTIAAGILYGAEAFALGVLIYRSVDSKGKVIGTTKTYTVSGGAVKYYNTDDIKFTGDCAGMEEKADGLLCAAMIRQRLYIDSEFATISPWNINDFVNNMNDKLKNGKLGNKLDIGVNGGLFYHTFKDSFDREYTPDPASSSEHKILFDNTSAMWNKVLTADDGTLCYNKDKGKAFSFEMIPLGSANADEVIIDMIKNKDKPVIALVDITKIDDKRDGVDLCYCVIYGITEKFDKSDKLVERKYNVFIPRKDYGNKTLNVKKFIEDYVVIDTDFHSKFDVKNWDYSKFGCWYENYNFFNFYCHMDLSNGHKGYLGHGTTDPGYYIFVKTK